MNDEYLAYLRTPEWRERRLMFMEEAGWCCENCGNKATEVHLKNYDCLGEEESEDVMVEMEKGTDLSYGDDYGGY